MTSRILYVALAVSMVLAGVFCLLPRSGSPRDSSPLDMPSLESTSVLESGPLEPGRVETRRSVPVLSPPGVGEASGEEEVLLSLVQARFFDPARRPLSGVELFLRGAGAPLGRSDARGRLSLLAELAPGTRELVFEARAPGYASVRRRAVRDGDRPFWLGEWVLEPGGVVRGRVLDMRGAVEGARVAPLEVVPDTPGEEGTRRPSGGEQGGLGAATVSGAGGSFVLEGVAAGSLCIVARKEGRAGRSERFTLVAGDVLEGVDVHLEDRREDLLEVRVIDPAGEPVPGARVQFETERRRHEQSADAHGIFRLELEATEGELSLRAHDPRGHHRSAFYRGRSRETLVLRLGEACRRELHVRTSTGQVLEALAYELVDAGGARLGASPGFPRAHRFEGGVSFAVPPEPYELRLRARGFLPWGSGLLDPVELHPLVCHLELGFHVEGRVSSGARPCAGAEVSLHPVPGGLSGCNGFPLVHLPEPERVTTSDEEGRFTFGLERAGVFHVVARDAAGGRATSGPLELHPDRSSRIELVLEPPGSLRVVLERDRPDRDRPDRELAGHVVGLSLGDGRVLTRRSDPEGICTFEGLAPGWWWVGLRDEEVRPGVRHLHALSEGHQRGLERVRVVAGELRELNLSLAGGGAPCSLRGRLRIDGRPAQGWKAHLREAASGGRAGLGEAVEIVDGHFRLERENGGPWELVLRGPAGEVVLAPVELAPGGSLFEAELERVGWEAPLRRPSDAASLDFHEWRADGLCVLHPLGPPGAATRVPPGRGRILRFDATSGLEPEAAEVLARVSVPRGAGE